MGKEGSAKGLKGAEQYYRDYGSRARELKGQGRRLLGYLCAFTPLEIITAAGFIPFRIKGDTSEPITKADAQMETIVCPLVRSCYDLSLKGRYDFLDGIVIPHACDSICRTYEVWQYTLNLPYSHLINMPHGTDDSSLEFYQAELETFIRSLSRFAGQEISEQSLREAIKLYNQQRAIVRELYQLRRSDPPKISGVEVNKLLVAAVGLPVAEATSLIASVIDDVKKRTPTLAQKSARLMVVGAQVDTTVFVQLVEDCGAWVVADDLCPGGREFMAEVDPKLEPIRGIAERYLRRIYCGRTFRPREGSYQDYLEERFGHIGRAITEFNVDGVILYFYKYCDPFGFEVPQMKSYIEAKGVPVLYLEDEYSMSSIARLRTRIQAFLEMVSSNKV